MGTLDLSRTLMDSAKLAADKIIKELVDIEVAQSNKAVYSMSAVQELVNSLSSVIKAMVQLERQVKLETKGDMHVRGNKSLGQYEMPTK